MKFLRQFMIIAAVCFVGEAMHTIIPLPVPASIYGLVLFFLLLEFKIVKLDQIKETAEFFLAIMPVLFVDPSVKLMVSVAGIKGEIVQVLLIAVLSTCVMTIVTGRVAQSVIRFQKKAGGKSNE